ncbi:MAG: hypothetical protein K9I94_05720 [Bacteroidales bacterium]|nr:hypothetical protein [Bacteroidales bacterium]
MRHLSEEEIAQYADALKNGRFKDLPRYIRQHVKECDQCSTEILAIYDLITNEDKGDLKTTEEELFSLPKRSFRETWFAIAAGFILLIGIGGFFLLFNKSPEKPELAEQYLENAADTLETQVTDTVPEITTPAEEIPEKEDAERQTQESSTEKEIRKERELLAQAYKPNPDLEVLVNRFDESAYRGNEVEVTTALHITVKRGQNIKLTWKNPAQEELTVELLNNNGERLLEKYTLKEKVSIEKRIAPGLYYWKLYNTDFDLLFAGKITVEK